LAEELARLGFSPLRLVDPDVLEVENLVRHPLGAPAVGLPKAPALAAKICREFPPCDAVGLHANFLELADSEQQQLAADADVVVAATDSAACQRHVNQVALAAGRSAVYPAAWVDPRIRDAEVGEILWVRPGRQTPLLPVRGRVPAGGGGHAGGPGRRRRHPEVLQAALDVFGVSATSGWRLAWHLPAGWGHGLPVIGAFGSSSRYLMSASSASAAAGESAGRGDSRGRPW